MGPIRSNGRSDARHVKSKLARACLTARSLVRALVRSVIASVVFVQISPSGETHRNCSVTGEAGKTHVECMAPSLPIRLTGDRLNPGQVSGMILVSCLVLAKGIVFSRN